MGVSNRQTDRTSLRQTETERKREFDDRLVGVSARITRWQLDLIRTILLGALMPRIIQRKRKNVEEVRQSGGGRGGGGRGEKTEEIQPKTVKYVTERGWE